MKKLFVAGIGPGAPEYMTFACKKAIEASDVIVGYSKYVELVKPLFSEKEFFDPPMMREVERCREALRLADSGKTGAMVCSGEAGVYGMSGLILELSEEYPEVDIEVVPGVTAALSGGAILGAPLTHDFAVISLSDLLTPIELIEKRLECAAMGDFCIALYNPSSKKRADYLKNACDILLKYKSPDTMCGTVRNIGREGEEKEIMTLAELREAKVDMFTTVFIGNEKTKRVGDRLVTPRGYYLG